MKPFKKIGLGTVQFGLDYGIANHSGKTPESEVSKILKYAIQQEISYLDTASAYGDSELVLGKNKLKDFKVVTKFMPPEKNQSLRDELEKSIVRLRVKKLYGFLAHRPIDLMDNYDQWDTLQKLKEENKVSKIGFSLNEPSELNKLLALGFQPDLIQVPYNFFDDRFEKQMVLLKSLGCEIHVRSVFLQGLFFMQPENLPNHFNAVKGILKGLQEKHSPYLSGALLKYVLDKEFIDVLIMGVENQTQLKHNLESITKASLIQEKSPRLDKKILMPSLWPRT